MDEFSWTDDDQRRLDRLIDGEMGEAERREQLARFEHSADGWRRCALAFLEQHEFRAAARGWTSEPAEQRPTVRWATTAGKNWGKGVAGLTLAAAAGFLVALVAGRIAPSSTSPPAAAQQLAVTGGAAANATVPPVDGDNLRLVVRGADSAAQQVVELPIVDAERFNAGVWEPWSQSLPDDVARFLEQAGHQVVRRRQVVPIDLRDGRRVVVPVDEVEIEPVSNRAYQ